MPDERYVIDVLVEISNKPGVNMDPRPADTLLLLIQGVNIYL